MMDMFPCYTRRLGCWPATPKSK
uniref:Uncharacterized protein n=1 Tax=Anguilla anguilla TaxID=7936 RepID=A0A0E9TF54_ANGAN